jgi:hypothetical protein
LQKEGKEGPTDERGSKGAGAEYQLSQSPGCSQSGSISYSSKDHGQGIPRTGEPTTHGRMSPQSSPVGSNVSDQWIFCVTEKEKNNSLFCFCFLFTFIAMNEFVQGFFLQRLVLMESHWSVFFLSLKKLVNGQRCLIRLCLPSALKKVVAWTCNKFD